MTWKVSFGTGPVEFDLDMSPHTASSTEACPAVVRPLGCRAISLAQYLSQCAAAAWDAVAGDDTVVHALMSHPQLTAATGLISDGRQHR